MAKFYCPRGSGPESPFQPPFNGEATWREDNTCSYCGSLDPDILMKRLEEGTIELGPTDKNYKVYVRNDGGDQFKQTYRNCGRSCPGPDDCTHWVTNNVSETKFYFQHLNELQKQEFVELLNAKKVKIGFPGHFYRTPYFISYEKKAE